MPRFAFCCLLLLVCLAPARAQRLQPGFDRAEYLELLRLHARLADDSSFYAGIAPPQQFRRVYRSPVVGLDNRWELWHNGRGVAVVSIRGTTIKAESWLANFYAAMLPARGELRLSSTQTFRYALADNPRAAVHAGWLVGTAALAPDILARLDSCYRRGTRDVLLMGHSQGGAIAFLLTAHLRQLQRQGQLPADLRLKTYCSAAPKPGNQYFAYEYEAGSHTPQGSWSVNVVNAADWVPETPVSIQTLRDFNQTTPFVGARKLLRGQPLGKRLALGYAFGRLDKPTRKAQRVYQRYLGTLLAGQVRKYLPEYQPGPYFPSNNYARIGPTVVLLPDAAYYQRHPDTPDKVFTHHLFQPYQYLAERLP
ncbi:lipase family protein [Hymenobacter sp. 15J16-1T3B]|uniref:lipase family protein n=1 Tax=Hymenobacter sp. 15J16-1T3B TaxID=2886941 RepID=UPI001D0FD020|nr:lipase family protein [Hymenobacter sp. 15J16-1T3B]MCC3158748.1 lipase family protein [Hymenobacter sp. 15J16-1T3B]